MKKITLLFISAFFTSFGFGQQLAGDYLASMALNDSFKDSEWKSIVNQRAFLENYALNSTSNKGSIETVSFIEVQNGFLQSDFKMTPNPAHSKFELTVPNLNEDVKMEVFDVLGKRVLYKILSKPVTVFNVTDWNSGVYLVRLTSDSGTQTKRLLKQ